MCVCVSEWEREREREREREKSVSVVMWCVIAAGKEQGPLFVSIIPGVSMQDTF